MADRIICVNCSRFKTFNRMVDVTRHSQDVHKKFGVICNLCGNGFRSSVLRDTHVDTTCQRRPQAPAAEAPPAPAADAPPAPEADAPPAPVAGAHPAPAAG